MVRGFDVWQKNKKTGTGSPVPAYFKKEVENR